MEASLYLAFCQHHITIEPADRTHLYSHRAIGKSPLGLLNYTFPAMNVRTQPGSVSMGLHSLTASRRQTREPFWWLQVSQLCSLEQVTTHLRSSESMTEKWVSPGEALRTVLAVHRDVLYPQLLNEFYIQRTSYRTSQLRGLASSSLVTRQYHKACAVYDLPNHSGTQDTPTQEAFFHHSP